jgi:hypothetical protein
VITAGHGMWLEAPHRPRSAARQPTDLGAGWRHSLCRASHAPKASKARRLGLSQTVGQIVVDALLLKCL